MKNNVIKRIVLILAVMLFVGFIVCYMTGMTSGVLAFGTLTPVLLLLGLYLTAPEDNEEIPMDKEDQEQEDHDRPHVDLLIDQLAERRERLEEKTKDLNEAESRMETLSQRVLALESENMEMSEELDALRSTREGLDKALTEAQENLRIQEEKVKDPAISILPLRGADEQTLIDISEAAALAIGEYEAEAKAADIRMQITRPDKALLIRADKRMVHILFKNIIDNAIKFMKRRGIFQITISDIDKDIFVVLKDDGEGLPPEETAHIFELNYQGSNRCGGNGLGLSQARAIAEYYGGTIYAKSVKDGGMGVYLHLPAADGDITTDRDITDDREGE